MALKKKGLDEKSLADRFHAGGVRRKSLPRTVSETRKVTDRLLREEAAVMFEPRDNLILGRSKRFERLVGRKVKEVSILINGSVAITFEEVPFDLEGPEHKAPVVLIIQRWMVIE